MFVSCGVPGSGGGADQPPLDDAARQACGIFMPVAGDVQEGRLTGPPLFRVLQDTFNAAAASATPGFAPQVQELYTAAINDDQPGVAQRAAALRARCAADG